MTLRILDTDPSAPASKSTPARRDAAAKARAAYSRQAAERQLARLSAEMDLLPPLRGPQFRGKLVAIIDSGTVVWADEVWIDTRDMPPCTSLPKEVIPTK